MRNPTLAALLGMFVLAPAHACEIALEGGWVRTAPPTAKVMAGFGTLRNPGRVESTLVKLSSPQFARVELHEMSMDGGVMKMRALDTLKLEAGGSASLVPGGMHLMLFEPVAPLPAGSEVALELTLECDSSYPARLLVAERAPEDDGAAGARPAAHAHDHGAH